MSPIICPWEKCYGKRYCSAVQDINIKGEIKLFGKIMFTKNGKHMIKTLFEDVTWKFVVVSIGNTGTCTRIYSNVISHVLMPIQTSFNIPKRVLIGYLSIKKC